jgi:hypothetical protein
VAKRKIAARARKTSMEAAEQAAGKVRLQLGERYGVGIKVGLAEGFGVLVIVIDDDPTPELPKRVDGVSVYVEHREMAHALGG